MFFPSLFCRLLTDYSLKKRLWAFARDELVCVALSAGGMYRSFVIELMK